MLASVAVAQWRKKKVIKIPCLDFGWASSIAAVSSTAKVRPMVLLQGRVGKYSGSLLVTAQETLILSQQAQKAKRKFSINQRPGVTHFLSQSCCGTCQELPDSSFGNSFSDRAFIAGGKELAPVSCTTPPPLWHPCCDSGSKRSQFRLLVYLSFESAFLCWKHPFRYDIMAFRYLFSLLDLLFIPE